MQGHPGQERGLRKLIPGKNKTVRFDQPPENYFMGAILVLPIGIGFLWCCLAAIRDPLCDHDWFGLSGAVWVLFLLTGICTVAAFLWAFYIVKDSSSCLTMEALSERLNVSELSLIQAARENNIVAPYNVRGRTFYRPTDFDSLSLLRPSTQPEKTDELLRAASNRPLASNQLLRSFNLPGTDTESNDTHAGFPPHQDPP